MSTLQPVASAHDPAEVLALLDDETRAILEQRRVARVVKDRGWLMRRMLAAADMVGLTFAFVVSLVFFGGDNGPSDTVGNLTEILIFLLTLPAWVVVANLYGLYGSDEERTDHSTADDLVGVFHLATVGSWLFFVGATLTELADPPLARLLVFWLLAIVLVTSLRALARAVCRKSTAYLQNTVIVGAGDVGMLIAHKFQQHPEYGLNLVGFVDANPKASSNGSQLPLLGPPEHLPEMVRLLDIERVVIAFSTESHEQTLDLVRSLKDLDVKIDIVPRLFEVLGTNVGIHTAEGVPLIALPALRLSRSALLLKRTMDLLVSTLGLLLLVPVFAGIAVAIKVDSRGPVFFRQQRMGWRDEVFEIRKFRTMGVDADSRKDEVAALSKHASGDSRMFKVPDDPRVTRVGRFLRRYSIDELPQLINVLGGSMSLVGPRPLILEEDRYVVDWRRRRLNLKPGITGLWQVLGRDGIPFEEMVKLDYLYVTTWSLLNDVKLVLRTIPILFRRHADV